LKNSFFQKWLFKIGVGDNPKPAYGWFGDYPTWQAAMEMAGGYEQENILERTRQSLQKIKSGVAVYERDSVLFPVKEYPYPLISCLLHIASAHQNTLRVVDFGGSLGSTWYQIRDFMVHLKEVSWHVVEQKNYVTVGKTDFEDDILKFHYTIEESHAASRPHVVLLSSVVQYLEEPHRFLKELAAMAPAYIVFDRTSFIDSGEDRLTVQRVHPSIYDASYPSWFFNEEKFRTHFDEYDCLSEFSSYVEGETVLLIDGKPQGKDKGFFLKRRL
jgi:putative methyltransferase (TIGR04325 family)